jgi:hypothetical protein
MADKALPDQWRRGARHGTPDEVVANILRVSDRATPRRLFDRKGGRVDPAAVAAVEALTVAAADAGATIGHIYKHGFPAATPREQAMDEALQVARAYGQPLSAEIVQTPEHEAAGEFLVKVLLLDGEGRGEAGPGPRT